MSWIQHSVLKSKKITTNRSIISININIKISIKGRIHLSNLMMTMSTPIRREHKGKYPIKEKLKKHKNQDSH